MMRRNTTLSIVKAIGIIAMVVGHAECPGWLCSFIFEWHMPLFFIAAGYFFKMTCLDDPWTFVQKRFKGLYLPFVRWSVVFLLLHNVFFSIGLMNERYGNAAGGVLHPYSWHQIEQNLWAIVTQMGGYDQFICGAYWFFRALLVSSILFLVLMKLGSRIHVSHYRIDTPVKLGAVVTIIALALALWKCGEGLRVPGLYQGGYRDIMGTFFFGIGFLFKNFEDGYKQLINKNIALISSTVVFTAVVWAFSNYAGSAMRPSTDILGCLKLPVPAIAGWLMAYNVSMIIDRTEGYAKRFLCYCGDHTLYIVLFHVLSYKIVDVLKIWYYDLDWQQIGCHMVIHEHSTEDGFWILYSLCGVLVPLGLNVRPWEVIRKLRSKL